MNSRELAERFGGQHCGPVTEFEQLRSLDTAGPGDLAYAEGRVSGEAGVLLCREAAPDRCCVVVEDPKWVFIQLLRELRPAPQLPPGVHPTAVLGEGVTLGEDVRVGPYVVLGDGCVLEEGAQLHPGVTLGPGCQIGAHSILYSRVVLYHEVTIGRGCIIHAGAVLGADGFSYHPRPEGPTKVPQVGRVVLGDGVEIGANSCVDRAFLDETRIGSGSALDNLVQVGHNTRLGRACMVAAQAGFSGSVSLGDGVLVGGQAGFADHSEVGDRVQLGARSGVHGRLPSDSAWLGTPVMPRRQARRVMITLKELPSMRRTLREILSALRDQGILAPEDKKE